jgi:hypothetical protein
MFKNFFKIFLLGKRALLLGETKIAKIFRIGVIVRFTGIVIVVIKIDAQKLAQERINVLF